jgi:hypothetical protein
VWAGIGGDRVGFILTEPEKALLERAKTGSKLNLPLTPTNEELPVEIDAMPCWGPNETIRAEVLRCLLVEENWPVHAKGVSLRGALISGKLDLESAMLRCPLVLEGCYFEQEVDLQHATVSLLKLTDCWLHGLTAELLIVTKELDLSRSRITGSVQIVGANITGQLLCRNTQITRKDAYGSLIADFVTVSSVFLNEGFTAVGPVRLLGAHIAGQLVCSGAEIKGTDKDGDALIADRVTVGGSVFLDRFETPGALRLPGATIAGRLKCSGAQIGRTNANAHPDPYALLADGITVRSDVFLDEGFTAADAVRLSGARIKGRLSLKGATLAHPVALVANEAKIGQQLIWAPASPVTGEVSLEQTQLHRLDDDWGNARGGAYWPRDGELRLTGLVYDGFGGGPEATCQQRLEWIRGQHKKPTPTQLGRFETQPYEQLALVYRESGNDNDARKVAIAARSDLREYTKLGPLRFTLNWLMDKSIRHGYRPLRAVKVLLALYVIALGMFFWAQHQDDVMVPAKNTTVISAVNPAMVCSKNYTCFYPAGYAVDVTIPIINTGQAEYWRPNAHAPWGWIYLFSTWIFTGLGWAFATLAVAGYTGLIRKD